MLTRPAALDSLSHDDRLEEFRVVSPRDVQLMLQKLADGSVLVSLHGEDCGVFTTVIWTLDFARGTMGFNADPADPAMNELLRCRDVTVVAYLDSVKLQFDVHNLVLVTGHKASVLNCVAPRELLRFQRRNAFRVRPPMRTAPTARFFHPDMPEVEMALRVVDISIGGCGLFLPDEQPTMDPGTVLGEVRIELDDDTRIEVTLRLQHSTITQEAGRGARLGFELVNPGGGTLRHLQRYIDLTQKRGKLMALT